MVTWIPESGTCEALTAGVMGTDGWTDVATLGCTVDVSGALVDWDFVAADTAKS